MSIRDFSSPLKTDTCSICFIDLIKFEMSCGVLNVFMIICYFISHTRISIIRHIFKSLIYILYVMWTESSKGPNIVFVPTHSMQW